MSSMIRPEEVVRLAAFVEAGDHLAKCEFFGEDDHAVISERFAQFGPATHLQAALAPFRRIWMNDENANFNRVAKIIEHHSVSNVRRGIAKQQRQLFNDNKAKSSGKSGLSITDIIDLWIYTQFAHCQTNRAHGRFVREDYDKWEEKVGKAQLEFDFRNAIRLMGMHFLTLYYDAALPEYKEWVEARGITPPFKAKNAFGSDYTETDDDGVIIQRGPNKFPEDELPPQKFARLLERQHYSNLKSILRSILGFTYSDQSAESYTKAYNHVLACGSIWDLLVVLGYSERSGCSGHFILESNFLDLVSYQKGSVIVCADKSIEFKDAAKLIIERLYNDFRQELMSKKKGSTFIDVKERMDKELITRKNIWSSKKLL